MATGFIEADPLRSETRARIDWVDYTRGVGIFLVVLGHVLRGLHSSGIILEGPTFQFIDSWIYAFHMPLFFWLSGLFAERRVGRGWGRFLRDVFGSIVYPYLVWSVIQTLLQSSLSRYTNNAISTNAFLGIMINPIMQFWFLYALAAISILHYTLRRIGFGPLAVLGFFIALLATSGWLNLGSWTAINQARTYGVYFALGAVVNQRDWLARIGQVPSVVLALLVGTGSAVVAILVVYPLGSELGRVMAPIAALSGSAASVALAVLLERMRTWDLVRLMGVDSLEIYVAHTIASAGLRIVLVKVFAAHNVALHVVIGTVGGIVLPMLLAWFCKRYKLKYLFRISG